MDYKAIIDFNKYTLALAATGFVYVLDNYKEAHSLLVFIGVIIVLALLLISSLSGILLASTATSRLHKKSNESLAHDRYIRLFGTIHISSLAFSMLILGVIVFSQFKYTDKVEKNKPEIVCCCGDSDK